MVFDIVIFGATGFTGKFISRDLSRSIASSSWPIANGSEFRWAIAGRSRASLLELRDQIIEESLENERIIEPEILVADITDYSSVVEVTKQAKCLISTQ